MNLAALRALLDGDTENALVALTPGGIEAQEARGQRDMAADCRLPRDIYPSREAIEALGIILTECDDDLFYAATLPEGWAIRPTDHAMHSDVIDAKGRARLHIFYKAAFYDRRASMRIERRFRSCCEPLNGWERPYDYEETLWVGRVYDTSNGCVAFETKPDTGAYGDLQYEAMEWLDQHYPDCENPLAYWDE